MVPRVQTFTWRLLRKTLPMGKRASKYSKHIKKHCSRCGNLEDELHMLFLCPFSRRLGSAILDLSKLNVLQNIIDLFPIRSKLCSPRNIRKLPQTLFTLFCGVSGKLVTTLCFAGKCVNLLKCLRQQMQLFQEPQWRLRKS
jgi:hypothetical protein